ncbi:MAG: FkbM family methyltransferase [Candidatus Pacebacteria bacterium]|jgi:FkbM family methyltransferase|nr:FkbM family methyltransferase [Candidatus Paceibacterota bacterium]
MDIDQQIKLYDEQLNKMKAFYSINGKSFTYILKKFRLVGFAYIRLQLIRLGLISDIVDTKLINGAKLKIATLDAGNQNFLLFGIPPIKEAPLAKFLLRELSSDTVFYDIGANYGVFTALASPIVTKGEIHAFEPNRNILPILQKTIAEISQNKKAFLVNKALSKEEGFAEFFDYRKNNDSSVSSLYRSEDRLQSESAETYTVSVITLDTYVKNSALPTFIKVDIESAEYDFLLGARNYLRDANPVVTLEFKQKTASDKAYSKKCLDFMTNLGYQPFKITEDGFTMPFQVEVLNESYSSGVSYENVIFKKI